MSSINTGYCEIMPPVGTGDCDFTLSDTKNDRELAHMIASEVVGEIVETAMEIVSRKNSSTKIGDINAEYETMIDGVEKFKITDDEELKKVEVNKLSYQGVGDQLEITNEVVADDKKVRHPPVEKKSRLTDLVKNSKQLLSKYILNDNVKHDHSDDENKEKVVQVIEMENIQEEGSSLKCPVNSGDVPLSSNSQELFKVDDETLMDVIQLEKEGTGDTPDNIKKTMTFPMAASSSSKCFSMSSKYRTLKMSASELKKKKWNIGTKFLNYLKKHKSPKKEGAPVEDEKAE